MKNYLKLRDLNLKRTCGAFYYYLDLSSFKIDSEKLVKKILNETGVVLTPGSDFDKKFGQKLQDCFFDKPSA